MLCLLRRLMRDGDGDEAQSGCRGGGMMMIVVPIVVAAVIIGGLMVGFRVGPFARFGDRDRSPAATPRDAGGGIERGRGPAGIDTDRGPERPGSAGPQSAPGG
jgi:hypothetical protein